MRKPSNKTISEIKGAIPDLNSEKISVLSDELDKILAIKTLFDSEGGGLLISILRNNCAIALRKAIIAAKAGDNVVPFILDYSANIDLLSSVQDISMEKEIRDQLEEAVKEYTAD